MAKARGFLLQRPVPKLLRSFAGSTSVSTLGVPHRELFRGARMVSAWFVSSLTFVMKVHHARLLDVKEHALWYHNNLGLSNYGLPVAVYRLR